MVKWQLLLDPSQWNAIIVSDKYFSQIKIYTKVKLFKTEQQIQVDNDPS